MGFKDLFIEQIGMFFRTKDEFEKMIDVVIDIVRI